MRDTELLVKALAFAEQAHAEQTRRGLADEPYLYHPLRVAAAAIAVGLGPEAVAAAVLHDVIEDTPLTSDDLREAGFPVRTRELVTVLSKWWPDDAPPEVKQTAKPAYYARIAMDPDAVVLKLLDRTDNLLDLRRALPAERSWARAYLRKTLREFTLLEVACLRQTVLLRYRDALTELTRALDEPSASAP